MSANWVSPPFDGMLMACSSEYLAGTTLNEESECHSRLPMANSRRRSSRGYGVLFLSRLETSAKVVGRRVSLAARRLVPIACSISPRLRVKASCWASSIFCSRNTSTAYRSMPAWIAATSSLESGRRMSTPSTSPAKHGPTWRMEMVIICLLSCSSGPENLTQRRPARRHGELVLLLEQGHALVPRRRPDARLHRLGAARLAIGHVLVGPDMDPLVERADVGEAREDQRRDGRPRLDQRRPCLDHLGDGAGAVGVGAELVDGAMLARLEVRRERRGMEDLALHLQDVVGDLGRPHAGPDRLGADVVAFVDVLVRPDMDDLVERADLGAPEAAEARQLGARRHARAEQLLDLGDAARLHEIGAHFKDHQSLLFNRRPRRPVRAGMPASLPWQSGRAARACRPDACRAAWCR